MFEYLKNNAAAVVQLAANKVKASYVYAAEKAQDTIDWYSDMGVTPREKVIATVAGIGAFGAAWAAFSLGFGSAPISLTTLAATPAATTLLTAIAAGTGFVAKKAIAGGLNLAADAVQGIAATHPDRNEGTTYGAKAYRFGAGIYGQGTRFDRYVAGGEYRPSNYSSEDYQLDADVDPITADEKKGLLGDLRSKVVKTFTRPTLFSGRDSRAVRYDIPSFTQAQLNKIPEGTTRSGLKFK